MHEPGMAPAMGDVYRAFALCIEVAGDEEGVGVADHRLCGVIQDRGALDNVIRFAGNGLYRPQLDVFGAVAVAVHHVNRETVVVEGADTTVHSVASAGTQIDAEQAHSGPLAQGSACRVADGRQAIDLQAVRVR